MGKWDSVRKTGYRAAAAALAVCAVCLAVRNGGEEGPLELLTKQAENEMISFWNPAFSFAGGAARTGVWPTAFPVLRFFGREQRIRLQEESPDTCEEIIRAEGRDEYADSLSAQETLTPGRSDGRVSTDDGLAALVRMENGVGAEQGGTAGNGGKDADPAGMGENSGENAGSAGMGGSGGGDAEQNGTAGNGGEGMSPDGMGGNGGENAARSGTAGYGGTGWTGLTGNGPAGTGQGAGEGVPASPKQEVYQWEYYEKYDDLVKEFYAVDASTAIDESQLNLKELLGRDLSVEKRDGGEPQILIYHTHSQEAFADSVPGDETTTIMGVGEVLAQILREQYGYSVLHHLGKYDVEDRDYAYNNSLPELEALLAENPGIEVVIDLHRDEVDADRRLVTQIDGRPTAMFMFFNGLSRTRKHGDIDYLPNENLADNLAFSFQMQVLCNEYYPGLTRRIYLKGYRYNMHLKPRYLLIEMGAQNNTYEECYNACIPLARMLDLELSGADFGYDG